MSLSVCTYSLSLQPEEKSYRCHNGHRNENFGLVYTCTLEWLRKMITENVSSVVILLHKSVKYFDLKTCAAFLLLCLRNVK